MSAFLLVLYQIQPIACVYLYFRNQNRGEIRGEGLRFSTRGDPSSLPNGTVMIVAVRVDESRPLNPSCWTESRLLAFLSFFLLFRAVSLDQRDNKRRLEMAFKDDPLSSVLTKSCSLSSIGIIERVQISLCLFLLTPSDPGNPLPFFGFGQFQSFSFYLPLSISFQRTRQSDLRTITFCRAPLPRKPAFNPWNQQKKGLRALSRTGSTPLWLQREPASTASQSWRTRRWCTDRRCYELRLVAFCCI